MNVTQSGLQAAMLGVQRGQQQINESAAAIASPAAGEGSTADLVTAVVGLRQGELQVEASAKALQVQYDSLGTLLDEKA